MYVAIAMELCLSPGVVVLWPFLVPAPTLLPLPISWPPKTDRLDRTNRIGHPCVHDQRDDQAVQAENLADGLPR